MKVHFISQKISLNDSLGVLHKLIFSEVEVLLNNRFINVPQTILNSEALFSIHSNLTHETSQNVKM
jgi:hypothetical protein